MVTPPHKQPRQLSSSTSVPAGLMSGGHPTVPDTDESDPGPPLRRRPQRQRCELARSQQLPLEAAGGDHDLSRAAKLSPDSRHALRNLSRSTPTMNRLESQTSFDVPRSQRKFLRRFKDLDAHEKIIKSFSCALVSDILLQGRLYVTSHHFAFYSNLFGHITRILIPCSLVLAITKEKTARIIPNAVAVTSSEGRHVFGSLLSRDSAFETMVRVWRKEIGRDPPDLASAGKEECLDDDQSPAASPDVLNDLSDSTATEENDSAVDFTPSTTALDLPSSGPSVKFESVPVRQPAPHVLSPPGTVSLLLSACVGVAGSAGGLLAGLAGGTPHHRSTLLLLLCNLLLLLIFCSSYASLTRMEEIQRRMEGPYQRMDGPGSLEEAERTLSMHLQQLAMVRKSLETLSSFAVGPHEST